MRIIACPTCHSERPVKHASRLQGRECNSCARRRVMGSQRAKALVLRVARLGGILSSLRVILIDPTGDRAFTVTSVDRELAVWEADCAQLANEAMVQMLNTDILAVSA